MKAKKLAHETAGARQRELRQKELKLKKWEEELKISESISAELENDKRKLEEYLCKAEARNVELEATIRMLHRRISLLDVSNFSTRPGINTSDNPQGQTVIGLQEPPKEDGGQQISESYLSNSGLSGVNEKLVYGIQQQVNRFISN